MHAGGEPLSHITYSSQGHIHLPRSALHHQQLLGIYLLAPAAGKAAQKQMNANQQEYACHRPRLPLIGQVVVLIEHHTLRNDVQAKSHNACTQNPEEQCVHK